MGRVYMKQKKLNEQEIRLGDSHYWSLCDFVPEPALMSSQIWF